MNATANLQPRESDVFRRQVRAHLGPERAQFDRLQRGVRVQGTEGLVGVEVGVFDDGRAPVVPFLEEPKAHRNPCGRAGRDEPDRNARCKLPAARRRQKAKPPGNGFLRRNRGPQALERSLAEKLLQRPGDRRADRPQFVVALTQPLVGRQARHEARPGSLHRARCRSERQVRRLRQSSSYRRTLLLQFRQRHARRRQPAHDGADRNRESRRRLSVGVPVAIDQQHRFALSLGKLPNRS